MTDRQLHSTGTPWEPVVGYSRAVRAGRVILVSGTTATDASGSIVGLNDAAMQTRQVIGNIQSALQALGSDLADVVRTRIYVTDISRWEEVGRVHGEAFGSIRPATSMVEVSRLIDLDMLVEIEADAIVREPQ
ncbi:MAG TPA: RidA family protein [Gemmatimonadales bacterium]|nr:RidA family protein [Gemmatimonadales bacterium]